jgi:2-polyprenyl-3-methyl-5-hydroxy-6-metoxy-1,4-benzoquinol methylase
MNKTKSNHPIDRIMSSDGERFSNNCPICNRTAKAGVANWQHICDICNFEFSDLKPAIMDSSQTSIINEHLRQNALTFIRKKNAKHIINDLSRLCSDQPIHLLDVGCAYGWFLELVKETNWKATGIEPEAVIARDAIAYDHDVIIGFFPDAVPKESRFGIITFNDVLEHIPNPKAIVQSCHELLDENGLLSITLPIRTGIFYRLAVILARIGLTGPHERMWQKNFHSPHVSYFSKESMSKLTLDCGFELVSERRMPSLTWEGLWARLRYDKNAILAVSVIQWILITLLIPLLSILPSDIMHFIYRKPRSNDIVPPPAI